MCKCGVTYLLTYVREIKYSVIWERKNESLILCYINESNVYKKSLIKGYIKKGMYEKKFQSLNF